MLLNREFDDQYAHAVIREFFSGFGLEGAVWFIETVAEKAASYKVWKYKTPDNLLFFMEQLHGLCAAAYLLNNNYYKNTNAVIQQQDDAFISQSNLLKQLSIDCGRNNTWSHFPRSLTTKQFYNPYKAVNKFCSYMHEEQWKQILKDVTEHALGRSSIHELNARYNMFCVRRHLLRLTEACHLIHLRIKKASAV